MGGPILTSSTSFNILLCFIVWHHCSKIFAAKYQSPSLLIPTAQRNIADAPSLLSWPWPYPSLPWQNRWWNITDLDRGQSLNNFNQLADVMYKLRNKMGIVVLAIGSSVVQDLGGCWPFELNHTKARKLVLEPPNAYTYGCCDKLGEDGWLSAFMSFLDQAFPGNDNVLINAGRGALPLWGFVEIGCLEANLPKAQRPDLILIENHEPKEKFSSAQFTEKVIWRLFSHPFGPPATLPLDPNPSPSPSIPPPTAQGSTSVPSCLPDSSGNLRTIVPAVLFMNTLMATIPSCTNSSCGGNLIEDEIQPLLRYYGFGAVSVRSMLRSLAAELEADGGQSQSSVMEADGHAGVASKDAVQIMSERCVSLMMDHVHPKLLGRVLYADLLAIHMLEAARHHGVPANVSPSLDIISSKRDGALNEFTRRRDRALSEVVLSEVVKGSAGTLKKVQAFDHDARWYKREQLQATRKAGFVSISNASGVSSRVLRGAGLLIDTCRPVPRLLPASSYIISGRIVYAMKCYGSLSPVDMRLVQEGSLGNLEVVHNTGFQYSEHQVHGDTKKRKPGWVANTSGSKLIFRVDSSFQAITNATSSNTTDTTARVSLLMLHSYEHMGMARLSCLSGCTCVPLDVDFHETQQRTSLLKSHTLEVTQHDQCVVEIHVLSKTTSGEFKVKLAQAVSKVPIPSSVQRV
ncbi:hypothetical protein CEUSTIGMA_g737.t1 [Chlamydomonas eustigma]|uniref:Uncharacterized protein n=1 Tax=Chlamydomonas eustigma TaxID=1157962 RepID=A0A250WR42_9CHLO|nr:hypothetical protein CEUSTIGMA_g737.t1 [Chlamydomonas eustigma]|eukprot:GAX73283.1 hypothetical protein CEUSTIGMA_g737.t1 [Chlamydomonas eustigma]